MVIKSPPQSVDSATLPVPSMPEVAPLPRHLHIFCNHGMRELRDGAASFSGLGAPSGSFGPLNPDFQRFQLRITELEGQAETAAKRIQELEANAAAAAIKEAEITAQAEAAGALLPLLQRSRQLLEWRAARIEELEAATEASQATVCESLEALKKARETVDGLNARVAELEKQLELGISVQSMAPPRIEDLVIQNAKQKMRRME